MIQQSKAKKMKHHQSPTGPIRGKLVLFVWISLCDFKNLLISRVVSLQMQTVFFGGGKPCGTSRESPNIVLHICAEAHG